MKIDHWQEWTPSCAGCPLKGRDFEGKGRGYAFSTESRKDALRQARQEGWKVIKGETFCPDCVAKKTAT